jgi:hypothetical protein
VDGFTLVDTKLNDFLEDQTFLINHIFGPKSISQCEWTRDQFNPDHIKYIFYITYPTAGINITYGIINLVRINGKALIRTDDSPEKILRDADRNKYYIDKVLDETGTILVVPFFDPLGGLKTNLKSAAFAYLKEDVKADILSIYEADHNNNHIIWLAAAFLEGFLAEYGTEPLLKEYLFTNSDPFKMDNHIYQGRQIPPAERKKGIDITKKPNLDEIRANAKIGHPSERYEKEIDMVWENKSNKEIAIKVNQAISTVVHDLEDIETLYGSTFVRVRSPGSKPFNRI